MPVLERLGPIGIPVSIDTMRAGVAAAAVLAGATLVNDVSGGLADPAMLATVASLDVDYVCQRWRGPEPATVALGGRADSRLATDPDQDPVIDLLGELAQRRDACLAAGIAPNRLILDPGIGFGTSADLDWAILSRLDEFAALGHRLLVGPSRKRFLDRALPEQPGIARRDAATAAVATWCAFHGAWAVRVHDIPGGWAGVRVARCLAIAEQPERAAAPRPAAF
jgi:dihydropteroate synthase